MLSPARSGITPELNQPRLLRVQFQTEFPHAFRNCSEIARRLPGTETPARHRPRTAIITSPVAFFSATGPPEIEHVMQIEISQNRQKLPTLRSPSFVSTHRSCSITPAFNHFLDQADDASGTIRCSTNLASHFMIDFVSENDQTSKSSTSSPSCALSRRTARPMQRAGCAPAGIRTKSPESPLPRKSG